MPVYFAGEGIDMATRSGRLAADIQAVVASDYIRNLREEAKRGIRKRLEQGFLPNCAPVGYLDSQHQLAEDREGAGPQEHPYGGTVCSASEESMREISWALDDDPPVRHAAAS
jgi:hypothetical protein